MTLLVSWPVDYHRTVRNRLEQRTDNEEIVHGGRECVVHGVFYTTVNMPGRHAVEHGLGTNHVFLRVHNSLGRELVPTDVLWMVVDVDETTLHITAPPGVAYPLTLTVSPA